MVFLNNDISKYGLHDTTINKILLNDDGITLCFEGGIFLLNDIGKEMELSKKCSIKIEIASFDNKNLYEHIVVRKVIKGRIKDITCSDFFEKLKSSNKNFTIYLDYYSDFAKSILIKGNFENSEYELIITEIENIEFIF